MEDLDYSEQLENTEPASKRRRNGTLSRFGTLTRRSVYRITGKKTNVNILNKDIFTYVSKNKRDKLSLKYVDGKLILKMKHRKKKIKAWIWNIEIEFFIQYITLLHQFHISNKNTKSDKSENIKTSNKGSSRNSFKVNPEILNSEKFSFSYQFKHDPDNITIFVSPISKRRKIKYSISLSNYLENSVKFVLDELQFVNFLLSSLKLEYEE